MKIFTKINELQSEMIARKAELKSIGFVPTMGYLHEGHVSLIEKARSENDLVVLSIFVNPLQFGPTEDFASYPRDIEKDMSLAENYQVDYLFYPDVEEMYSKNPSVKVRVQNRTDVLCGKSRPGHFDGVATVLTKLFHITLPERAYFGMKDAQQVAVVDGLIKDFHFPIELVPVPTVREEDGLAKSSRNVNLLETEREQAPAIYQCLQLAEKNIHGGETNPFIIKKLLEDFLTEQTDGEIDYIEIYSYPELTAIEQIRGKVIIAIAVKFSQVRLIDNLIIVK